MDFTKKFGTDQDKENKGTWIDYEGCRLLIARIGNDNFKKKSVELLNKKKNKLLPNQQVDLSEKEVIGIAAETVLLDWTGITYNGEDLPYSVENCKQLLSNKDFFKFISDIANNVEIFRSEVIEEDKENLGKS